MRTAARTSLLTVALAGALLAPAAGAAYAAAPQAAPAASVSGNDRYTGTPVHIGEGLVAVLRYKAEGPEAWIRSVPRDWKPGDSYMGEVLATLDHEHRSGTVGALKLELVAGGTEHIQTLVVTKDGKSTSYRLPKGQGSECQTGPVEVSLGAGLEAQLLMSPNGPEASLLTAGKAGTWKSLNRANPSLPEDAGVIVRILNANSAAPVLEWKVQGGDMPFGHEAFPKLRTGCTYNYTLQNPTQKPQPETKPSAKPSAKPTVAPSATPSATPAAPKQQTAGQTSVVPKGGVAAGAEIAAQDTDDSTTALAGTGLAAILAGLGAFVLLRGRRTARR